MNEDQMHLAEPFLRAAMDRPNDSLPRLIFADWLDERGFSRQAKYQRRQARLCQLVDMYWWEGFENMPEYIWRREMRYLVDPPPEL